MKTKRPTIATLAPPDVIVLSARDQEAFARALLRPAKPCAKLKAAVKRYKAWTRE